MFFIIRALLLTSLIIVQSCSTSPVEETESTERVITVEGKAKIQKGANLLARKQAFRNAMNKALTELGEQVSNRALLASTKVVDEWITDDVYHLQTLSVLSKQRSCNSPYKKNIVATAFPVVTSGQLSANESQDLYSGIPREIMNILMESGHFIGHNETHTSLYSIVDMAPELADQNEYQEPVTIQVAQKKGDQFVLSGVIRDLEVESTEYVRGAGIAAQIKSMTRDFVSRRGIAIDVYVHDGFSGALLFQHRYTDKVVGDVWIPSGYTVGSERFKSTPSGHKISNIIQLASKDISELLSCYPLSAKIIKVENNKVYLTAGIQNKLVPGDHLVVYGKQSKGNISEQNLIGVIHIMDVQPRFSTGKMEVASDSMKIKAGDLVKSW